MRSIIWMLFAIAGEARSQDLVGLPTVMQLAGRSGATPKRGETQWSSELAFRYSLLGGSTGFADQWNDNFEDGFGIRGETDFEYFVDPSVSVGGYLSAGVDLFSGKTVPPSVSLSDWVIIPFVIGPKLKWLSTQGFFAEVFLGVGFVAYNSVDATIAGFTPRTVLDFSLAFALEIGTHFGYKFTQHFGVIVGVVYEYWGAPSWNQTILPGASAGSLEIVAIDVGVWFRF